MKNQKDTIRKMVSYLNDQTANGGGFWLPNIQRPFVWKEDQIECLFDSIMRQYPISTLLIWKTKSGIKKRKFIDNYHSNLRLTDFYVPVDNHAKMLVLDGQQRLQSLFIGLKGAYEKKELYFNLLSGDSVSPEEMRYEFKFLDSSKATFPFYKFKDIVFSSERPNKMADRLCSLAPIALDDNAKDIIKDNIESINETFIKNEVISYQELDSIDNPDAYSENDVVEIFIRANSGGTKLGKSDLLFSLLVSSWDDAESQLESLLEKLNKTGYLFTRDFVLKTCLTLLDKGARYDIAKFRHSTTKDEINTNWQAISAAISDVKDYLYGKTFIRSDKALPSYLGLIPVIYFRYKFPKQWDNIQNLDTYILRTLLTGAFSGTPDNLIDKCVKAINTSQQFNVKEIFGVIVSNNRNLTITQDNILNTAYGDKDIHLIFNLWYQGFDYQPSFSNNLPQVDHIFPQSLLRNVKDINPATGNKDVSCYKPAVINQIANCMLLTAQENGAGGKTNIPPEVWFEDKSMDYLEKHLIPKDKSLWQLENYENFIAARKLMIIDKFKSMLQGG